MSAYPDEQTFWPDFEAQVAAIYAEAGQPFPDAAAFRWFTRTAYDLAGPLTPAVSREKHLNELRAALSIPTQEPACAPLEPLTIRDFRFWDATGQPWIWKGCTDFLLYQRFLEGEDIRPILLDRRYVGANLLRVLGMCHNIARFYPRDYGDRYFTALPEFCALLGRYGFRCEFVVFADAQIIMPNESEQQEHWRRFCDAAAA